MKKLAKDAAWQRMLEEDCMNGTIVCNIVIAVLALVLTGCTVGPDFQRPAPPEVSGYTSTPLTTGLASSPIPLGRRQTFLVGKRLTGSWWQALGSEKLDRLVNEALAHSFTLAEAEATLRQAQELYAARAGSTQFPQLSANLGVQGQRFNPQALGQAGDAREFSLYNAGVGVRYIFDLAGGNRRALESLAARSDYQRFRLAGARLTLAANLVTTAITQASLNKQIGITEDIVKAQEEQLALTRERIRLGHGQPDDELALQTQLAQTRASLPLLRSQLQQNDHLLAILLGKAPGTASLPSFSLNDFNLPPELPLLIPSELVRARPDILGAEALLHAANAGYGVAIANLYPQLTLSGDLGSQALTTGALFGSGSTVWNVVSQLTQPLFNPGLPAEKRAALAAFDAAAANYQSVVLEALRNVADVLGALDNDAKRLRALAAADAAFRKSLESTQRRHGLGAASFYDLLTARQQRLRSALDVTEGQARRLINTVALYQAMGGGLIDGTGEDGVKAQEQVASR